MNLIKITSLFIILLLIANLILFAMRKISTTIFWAIIGLGALSLYIFKKKWVIHNKP